MVTRPKEGNEGGRNPCRARGRGGGGAEIACYAVTIHQVCFPPVLAKFKPTRHVARTRETANQQIYHEEKCFKKRRQSHKIDGDFNLLAQEFYI
jgi:hypothetical protein